VTLIIDWYDAAQSVIKYDLDMEWKWPEFYKEMEKVDAMMQSVYPQRVDVIVNLLNPRWLKPDTLVHLRNGALNPPPNWGLAVFVGLGRSMRALLATFSKMYPRLSDRYAVAETVDEAYALIVNRRGERHLLAAGD
jgi:hypothetical protein